MQLCPKFCTSAGLLCVRSVPSVNRLGYPFLTSGQVDEVKGIMTENIEKVLARGEKLELLTDKTENLMTEVSHECCATSQVL